MQECMIRPDRAKRFSDAMRMCCVVIKNLSKMIQARGLSTSVGDEGGFAPMIKNNNQALDLIVSAIKKSGFVNGKDVSICLDIAANELYKRNRYSIHSKKFVSVNSILFLKYSPTWKTNSYFPTLTFSLKESSGWPSLLKMIDLIFSFLFSIKYTSTFKPFAGFPE
mgnify:CR=1 FL=1